MTSCDRNTKVVALLIASMTLGAVVLLWAEPPTPGWSSGTLLMAESAQPVREVRIEYTDSEKIAETGPWDCIIRPDGQCVWQPGGEKIRVLIDGDGEARLSEAQARTLLAVFGSLTQRHGLDLHRVWLHPASDARLHPELPPAAHDLCRLLVRKGIIP